MLRGDLTSAGRRARTINVQISPRSIELFSQGLYRSPHKAIEELVANAFDAGAAHTQVLLRRKESAVDAIVVIDDGCGMDDNDLQQHWLIGESNKRQAGYVRQKGREPIGKFGIGKLATFVLAEKLTHISKQSNNYYAATMDFGRISAPHAAQARTIERKVSFPARVLTADEAKRVLAPFVAGSGEGFEDLKLFGTRAASTWTVAILTDLKDLVNTLKEGRLRWVLSTAMPMGDGFKLYLDGNRIESSREHVEPQQTWIVGKDFVPETAGFEVHEDRRLRSSSVNSYSVSHPDLGRISGTFEVYRDPIIGKPDAIGRNNGFFIYVRKRLINEEDLYFGIPEDRLRHGTLSRFRMSINANALDDDILSSREDVVKTARLETFQSFLEEAFKAARNAQNRLDEERFSKTRASDRLASAPLSVSTIPLLSMVQRTLDGKALPFLSYVDPAKVPDKNNYLADLSQRFHEGNYFSTEIGALSPDDGIAKFDVDRNVVTINTQHPFVAAFSDDFGDARHNEALELFAVAEVLLEASLYETVGNARLVREVVERRDGLLRALAKDSTRRNASLIALNLWDTRHSPTAFEYAIADAFSSMGYVAERIGGKGNADAVAEARISGGEGARRAYSTSIEAKTVEKRPRRANHEKVRVGTLARHRDKHGCDYALVVGEAYVDGEDSALLDEVKRHNALERAAGKAKVITLIRLADLQRLVRLMPVKKIGLDRMRDLFGLETPDAVAKFVSRLEQEEPPRKYFRHILNEIAQLQQEKDKQVIAYEGLQVSLRIRRHIDIELEELVETCKALQAMSGGLVFARPSNVEINSSPQFILDVIAGIIRSYPEDLREVARAVLADSSATPTRRKGTPKRAGRRSTRRSARKGR
jgi:hypothetical protein